MGYTPGTLCPAWTLCMLAAGTQPSQITKLLSWKCHTQARKKCHTQVLDNIRPVPSFKSHFTLHRLIFRTVWSRDIVQMQFAMQTSFQLLERRTFGNMKNRKLGLCMEAEGQGRFWHCCCLVFMHDSWTCFHDNSKTPWPALQHLLPWQLLTSLSCLAGSTRNKYTMDSYNKHHCFDTVAKRKWIVAFWE